MMPDTEKYFELYKLFLATAEKVSDRRAQANVWLLSVNSAIIGLYGYLGEKQPLASVAAGGIWRFAIPAAGIILCLTWAAVLGSYGKLNGAKFKVLHELEAEMAFAPFAREQYHYKLAKRSSLSGIERRVPWIFMALYIALILIAWIPA